MIRPQCVAALLAGVLVCSGTTVHGGTLYASSLGNNTILAYDPTATPLTPKIFRLDGASTAPRPCDRRDGQRLCGQP